MSNALTPEPEDTRCDARERTIAAPCEQVYAAFRDAACRARSWGPRGTGGCA